MPAPSTHALPRLGALVAREIDKSYGATRVLSGVEVVAAPGRPLGLVGENGSGKSTLLRILAGAERPDAGSVARPDELVYLAQEPTFPAGATVASVLDTALAPLHHAAARLERLAAELEQEEVAAAYTALLDWAEVHEVWSADRRVAVAAERLGLSRVATGRPVSALSGGERSRLAIAAVVARRPLCVLMDEPTNHLDDQAVAFLEDFLGELPGVAVVASHDRMFLDNVAARVLDLDMSHFGTDGLGGSSYGGGYSAYLAAKRASRRRWEEAYAEQQRELADLRRSARTTARQVSHDRPPRDNDKLAHRAKGQKVQRTVGRRVNDVRRRIALVEQDPVPRPRPPLSFSGDLTTPCAAAALVRVRELVVAGRLSLPHLTLAAGEHLLVEGANGSGKSTLLRVIHGLVRPTSGAVDVGARRVGYLPQEVTFARPDRSAAEVYDSLTASPVPLRALDLLQPRDVGRPVGVLSLGQQRRLALAVLVAQGPDLALLDEPTNHISPALAEELEESLGRSPGTIVVATHDRWLRSRWEGPVLTLAGQLG